ncbi:hypothetical protein MRB53_039743 [Persea americana]|nr:hypothetical protein MRB53_039743 [Persea americana]
MLQDFETWGARCASVNKFTELEASILGIDASWFLDVILQQADEPLVASQGGLPHRAKGLIEDQVGKLRAAGVTLVFVFPGLSVGNSPASFQVSADIARANAEAWAILAQKRSANNEEATQAFGLSGNFARGSSVASSNSPGYLRPENCFAMLQSILSQLKVQFIVAPHSAWGQVCPHKRSCALADHEQLAYILQNAPEYMDAVAGPSELFLFGVPQIITALDFEREEFTFVQQKACCDDLGGISADVFVDACLLLGSSLISTFPPIAAPNRRHTRLQAAAEMVKTYGQSAHGVCMAFQEDSSVKSTGYLDKLRRAKIVTKHHVVMTMDGAIEPLDAKKAPSDMAQVIGARLPDEIYYYLSIGAISPRVLQQIISKEVIITEPAAGGDSAFLRSLVQSKLSAMRLTTLNLLTSVLTFAYNKSDLKLRLWFDPENGASIVVKDIVPSKAVVDGWHVKQSALTERKAKTVCSFKRALRESVLKLHQFDQASLAFAITYLVDKDSAAQTVGGKDVSKVGRPIEHELKTNADRCSYSPRKLNSAKTLHGAASTSAVFLMMRMSSPTGEEH